MGIMSITRLKPAGVRLSILMWVMTAIFFALPLSASDNTIPYRQEDHGSFEEEWAPHDDVFGWWYLTGLLHDVEDPDLLYAYQYTVFHVSPGGAEKIRQMELSTLPSVWQLLMPLLPTTHDSYIYSLTLIDLQTGQRQIELRPNLVADLGIYADENTVSFLPQSILFRGQGSMTLSALGTGIQLELEIDMGKGAVWHGDDGVLEMSCPAKPQARTVYYSYPNMPTFGTMTFTDEAGKEIFLQVEGQSWFDRQWGPLGLDSGGVLWEWFSLRFFDNEEVMLFAFPQSGYQDATHVDADGNTRYFGNFTYTTNEIWQNTMGHTFSWVWDVDMPGVKDERYRIVPMIDKPVDDQLELALWMEIPAEIFNEYDELVGYAFVELVNGARDEVEEPCNGGDPGDPGCDGKLIVAAGKYFKALSRCAMKWAMNRDDQRELDCIQKAEDKFESRWMTAENAATKKAVDCTTASMTDIEELIEAAHLHIYAGITGGMDLEYKNAGKFGRDLMKATRQKCFSLFTAESANMRKPDSNKLNTAIEKAEAKFDKRWEEAINKARKNGILYNGISMADAANVIDGLVGDVLFAMGYGGL